MDRETEATPRQAPAANGLPPIFQRPTYPSGEPATRAPERDIYLTQVLEDVRERLDDPDVTRRRVVRAGDGK